MAVIQSLVTLALRCPQCGNFIVEKDSLFVLQGNLKEVFCSCGDLLMRYQGRGSSLRCKLMCSICEK